MDASCSYAISITLCIHASLSAAEPGTYTCVCMRMHHRHGGVAQLLCIIWAINAMNMTTISAGGRQLSVPGRCSMSARAGMQHTCARACTCPHFALLCVQIPAQRVRVWGPRGPTQTAPTAALTADGCWYVHALRWWVHRRVHVHIAQVVTKHGTCTALAKELHYHDTKQQ